jgi:hypothetical protein
MLRNFPSSLRRAALASAVVAMAAASFVGHTTPAEAFGMRQGGGGGFHGGGGGFNHGGFGGFNHGGFGGFNHGGFGGFDHGGFRHEGFRDFHHGFDHRFAFGGFGYFPGYYDDYADYDGCLRRVWGPGGWRLVNVCY